ncbi:NAD(P)-dependent dehydrogenase (short-subunit alcohol dehydrogenase family) [Bradyrhizobium sp. USDA 223]
MSGPCRLLATSQGPRAASRVVRPPKLPKAKRATRGFYPRMSRCYSFARAAVSGAVTKKHTDKGRDRSPMKDFAGKIAVITGGGTGMGRELARQLVAEGCNVAMCDVSEAAMAETKRLCEVEKLPQGLRVTTHVADVAIEDHLKRFRDEVAEQQKTEKVHLLFNNAGIGGGGSLFTNTREQWERTFNICWGGVYLGVRTFLPMLVAADEAHIVNTASVNGFWASIGMGQAHTAYSSAKFAVKGFTEALINDLRLHAPHVKCSVVMPGHIGTSIVSNSRKVQSGDGSERLNADEVALTRKRMAAAGVPDADKMSDEDIQAAFAERARSFLEDAPTTAAQAAKIILDGVKAERWRILVGEDAERLDERVRATPEQAYDRAFYESFTQEVGWRLG